MIQVRFHGRGGQGAKIASRVLGRSGFLSGLQVQGFALFGAERRGAPVVSFTRLGNEPIDQRGYIDEPNLVVVIDDSLLREAPGPVFHGVDPTTPILVNGDPNALGIITKDLPPADYYSEQRQKHKRRSERAKEEAGHHNKRYSHSRSSANPESRTAAAPT